MKKFVMASLASAASCIATLTASEDLSAHLQPWIDLPQNLRIVNVSHLTEDDLNEMMQGYHPEMVVEFSAQTTLPISFFLRGDLVNLVESEGNFGTVEIQQTFYARCVEKELMFCTHLTDWRPFSEFMTGHASVALSIQDGQPSLVVGAETNCRSSSSQHVSQQGSLIKADHFCLEKK